MAGGHPFLFFFYFLESNFNGLFMFSM